MRWEQHGTLSFRIVITAEPTKRYENACEEAARWCRDQFDQSNWARSPWGTWKITFVRAADAVVFKLRWC